MRNPNYRVSVIREYITPCGNPIHNILERCFDGERTYLKVVGKENIQEIISSYAPYCDLEYMLHRLSIGDYSCINRKPALFGDFSGMPDNLTDAVNIARSVESRFATLDKDTRAKYGNDWRKWIVSSLDAGSSSSDLTTGGVTNES